MDRELFVFAVGAFDPFSMKPEEAETLVMFIKNLPGFFAIHPDVNYNLLCFDTLEHAISSRGIWTETGNEAGRYIMNAKIEGDEETLMVGSPAWDSKGGMPQ